VVRVFLDSALLDASFIRVSTTDPSSDDEIDHQVPDRLMHEPII
jgi:hypothetical protein